MERLDETGVKNIEGGNYFHVPLSPQTLVAKKRHVELPKMPSTLRLRLGFARCGPRPHPLSSLGVFRFVSFRFVSFSSQVFLGFNQLTSLDGAALLNVSAGLTELHVQVLQQAVGRAPRLAGFPTRSRSFVHDTALCWYF